MIRVENLCIEFGSFALRDISLDLAGGGSLAILGPSGAGKSLLLESVMGARTPRSGRVLLDGRDVTSLPPEQRGVSYIPQDLALFPHLDVRGNVLFGLRTTAERRDGAELLGELSETLGIRHLLDRRDVRTLSGGEQSRVALARALMVRPRVLFLDEPFAALDTASRMDLVQALRDLRRIRPVTLFLVTHDLDEAALLADDVAILMEGVLVDRGPVGRVLQHPRTRAAARFLNFRNILPPPPGSPPETVAVAIHPGRVQVSLGRPEAGMLAASVLEVIPANRHAVARLRLADGTPVEANITHAEAAELLHSGDSPVAVLLPADACVPLSG